MKNTNEYGNSVYKIGLIDFGIISHISREMRETFMFVAYNYRDERKVPEIVRRYFDICLYPRGVIENMENSVRYQIVKDMEHIFISSVIEKSCKTNQSEMYAAIQVLNYHLENEVVDKYNIKMSEDFINMQVVISMGNGLVMKICNDNLMEYIDKVSKEMFHLDLDLMDPIEEE